MIFTVVLYLPMILMAILSFQGVQRLARTSPCRASADTWWQALFDYFTPGSHVDRDPLGGAHFGGISRLPVGALTAFFALTLSMAFRRRFRGDGVLFYLIMLGADDPRGSC